MYSWPFIGSDATKPLRSVIKNQLFSCSVIQIASFLSSQHVTYNCTNIAISGSQCPLGCHSSA
ncbi:hypothetical protein HET73_01770 [Wolbachia endosymbiont of Atemnus politus]|nr:hypothetical protein [Wolbachia endosymbiont of Atemnus politus]